MYFSGSCYKNISNNNNIFKQLLYSISGCRPQLLGAQCISYSHTVSPLSTFHMPTRALHVTPIHIQTQSGGHTESVLSRAVLFFLFLYLRTPIRRRTITNTTPPECKGYSRLQLSSAYRSRVIKDITWQERKKRSLWALMKEEGKKIPALH